MDGQGSAGKRAHGVRIGGRMTEEQVAELLKLPGERSDDDFAASLTRVRHVPLPGEGQVSDDDFVRSWNREPRGPVDLPDADGLDGGDVSPWRFRLALAALAAGAAIAGVVAAVLVWSPRGM